MGLSPEREGERLVVEGLGPTSPARGGAGPGCHAHLVGRRKLGASTSQGTLPGNQSFHPQDVWSQGEAMEQHASKPR